MIREEELLARLEVLQSPSTAPVSEVPAAVELNELAQPPAPAAVEVKPQAALARTVASVSVVQSAAQLAAMRKEWTELLEASDAGAFNGWEWLYPWCRRIGTDRELYVLTARDAGGALLGLMPLAIEKVRVGPVSLRRLAFIGETHVGSDYLDVVARRGLERSVAAAFAGKLREDEGRAFDVIDLLDFASSSVTVEVLTELFKKEGYGFHLKERYLCPFEKLDAAEPFDAFLKRTGRRDNFLRRKKWLEKQPGYEFEKVTDPAKLARPLADFFKLHSLRWSADGGSQGIKGPSVEAFHRDATSLLAEGGKLRMYTLRLAGAPLASVYGIIHGKKFLYFQSGYDPAWRNKSVGLVLIGETFREAMAEGCTEYDFLRGTESYKADWTTQRRQTLAVRIYRSGGKGALLEKQERTAKWLRDTVKKLMPTNLVEKIRRLRRKRAAI